MSKIIETIEQKLERLEKTIETYAEAFLHHTHTLPNTPVGHEPVVTYKPVIRPPAAPSFHPDVPASPASVTLEPTPVVIAQSPLTGETSTVALASPNSVTVIGLPAAAPEAPAPVVVDAPTEERKVA